VSENTRGSQAASKTRCHWATNEINIPYHDAEWGVPQRDERILFEFLILEGAQAGLSWDTILRKRARYREVFDNFEADIVAGYGKRKLTSLLGDAGIIRNRLKLEAAITNAKLFLATQQEFGSFGKYIWEFVDGKPLVNSWKTAKQVPATTAHSDRMSKDLKRRGFKFIGSTICYAFMQATGMVNDHLTTCFRYHEVSKAG
jgi:DNA-3-methyladenine glycosylase I